MEVWLELARVQLRAMLSGNGSSRSNPQKDKRTFSRSNTSSSFGNRAGSKVGAGLRYKIK